MLSAIGPGCRYVNISDVVDNTGGRVLTLIDEAVIDEAVIDEAVIDEAVIDEAVINGATADPGRDQLLDIALGPALLQQVAADGGPETLRVYRPRPTLAFSGRDCAATGIGAAVEAARRAGFRPVRRGPGGRATGYHLGALCLDHIGSETSGLQDIRPRFAAFGQLLAGALRELGVDARVGPVPGEYCPGEFSINDGRGHKLIGTAQRLVRGGWLFGTVILVTDPEPVREVLTDVYSALDLAWDHGTVDAVSGSVAGVTVDDAKAAVLHAYARLGPLVPGELAESTLDLARSRADRHRLGG